MDCSKFIDSLDSLWFFFNALSSTTKQSGLVSGEQTVLEEPAKQNLGKKCRLCGQITPELTPPVQHLESFDLTNPEEKIKSRRSGRRWRRSKRISHERKNIPGEVDLGFARNESSSKSWVFDFEEKSSRGYQVFRSQLNYHMNMKMPPLEDALAMKEHLKSWAYAVACTVK